MLSLYFSSEYWQVSTETLVMVNNINISQFCIKVFFFFNFIRLLSLFQSHCHINAKQISNFCK